MKPLRPIRRLQTNLSVDNGKQVRNRSVDDDLRALGAVQFEV
jgi:hypothetical protein